MRAIEPLPQHDRQAHQRDVTRERPTTTVTGVDAIEVIMTTRAMRRFSDQPVDDADIETCLRAAQQGPSGGNVQPQQYLVVTDPERKAVGRALVQVGVRPIRRDAG